MKVKIAYFRGTGKYYSDEEYESTLPEGSPLHHYWDELEQMFAQHKRPGLIDGENEFFVTIEVPEHEHAHPRLILPKEARCTCDENCDDPCPVHAEENALQDRAIKAENEVERLRVLYEKEFDKRTAIRKWWRSNVSVDKGGFLTTDWQALTDLRELIADHNFDEHMTLGTKDQRIFTLKEELAYRDDRIEELEKENFSLSAAHCEHSVGDERGHLTCKYQDLERQLRALIADSRGVSHVHQSEDVAPWEELIETGFLDALKDNDAES